MRERKRRPTLSFRLDVFQRSPGVFRTSRAAAVARSVIFHSALIMRIRCVRLFEPLKEWRSFRVHVKPRPTVMLNSSKLTRSAGALCKYAANMNDSFAKLIHSAPRKWRADNFAWSSLYKYSADQSFRGFQKIPLVTPRQL